MIEKNGVRYKETKCIAIGAVSRKKSIILHLRINMRAKLTQVELEGLSPFENDLLS